MPRASLHTLGCRLNQAEEALIAGDLAAHGYEIVPWGDPADVVVVNSCVVTATAGQKSRQAVRAARRAHPEALVVVAGCAAHVSGHETLGDIGADLIIPNSAKTHLSELLPIGLVRNASPCAIDSQTVEAPVFAEPGVGLHLHRTRAAVKVQEGCDCACTYCIVPATRGMPRSRRWEDVLRDARAQVEAGVRELVLTGVHTARYNDHGRRLPELVRTLLELGDGFRIRLSSLEPGPGVEDLVELVAQTPRICRFLHLPAQHLDDTVLRAMGRPYTAGEFAEFANHAVSRIPGLCFGTDLIVGFPGETEAEFERCLARLAALPVGLVHTFRFSPRPGTPAADLSGRPPGDVVAERLRRVAEVVAARVAQFAKRHRGDIVTVLTEGGGQPDDLEGWSDNYLRVRFAAPGADPIRRLVRVRLGPYLGGRRLRGELASYRASQTPESDWLSYS